MFKPYSGKETKSSILRFDAASNRFKCKHSTRGKRLITCCFFVNVFCSQEGQSTGSANISGMVKWRKQRSTDNFLECEVGLSLMVARWTSLDSGKEMLMNDSVCDRLFPHSWQINTDRNVPSNNVFTRPRSDR